MTEPATPGYNTSGRYHPCSDRNRFQLDDVDLDTRIRHASTRVFVSKDLLRPSPGIVPFGHRGFLPFGKKAQNRREARATVDEEAAQRRTALRWLLEQRLYPNNSSPRNYVGAGRSTPRQALLILLAVVFAIVGAGIWTTRDTGTAPSSSSPNEPIRAHAVTPTTTSAVAYSTDPVAAPMVSSGVSNSSLSGEVQASKTDSVELAMPIPTSGVPVITMIPDPIATRPPETETAVNLVAPGTPEAAVALWASLWCPIDYRQGWRAQRELLRALMTTDGFDWYTQSQPDQPPTDWSRIVAQQHVATCGQPSVEAVTEAPRTDTSATVQLRITRTTTTALAGAVQSPFVEQLRLQLLVQRTTDGPWLVGEPTWAG